MTVTCPSCGATHDAIGVAEAGRILGVAPSNFVGVAKRLPDPVCWFPSQEGGRKYLRADVEALAGVLAAERDRRTG